jgi:two-component system chemotaxis response regulator CheB
LAPANYHLLIEANNTFSLTIDPKVNFCRPAIDVLFETAAGVYRDKLIGVLLTGANSDGARGLQKIKQLGGVTIVEDPQTAEVSAMPMAAIEKFKVDYILPLEKIYAKLSELCHE